MQDLTSPVDGDQVVDGRSRLVCNEAAWRARSDSAGDKATRIPRMTKQLH